MRYPAPPGAAHKKVTASPRTGSICATSTGRRFALRGRFLIHGHKLSQIVSQSDAGRLGTLADASKHQIAVGQLSKAVMDDRIA